MNQELNQETLKERLAKNPGVVLENLQERYQVSLAGVLEALPENMWKKIDGSHFVEVLTRVATIGPVMVLIHTADSIFEISGDFPTGETSHGYYNLHGGKSGLHGHLKPEKCQSIYFVERPFMKRDTASILFMNQEGNAIFKIFLGRNEDGQIRPEQLAAFHEMAQMK